MMLRISLIRVRRLHLLRFLHLLHEHLLPWMPNAGQCAGEEFAAFAGMIIITSYLVLFISFYIATYNKTSKAGRPRRNTGRQSLIEMRNAEIPAVSGAVGDKNATTTGRSNGPVTRSRKA